MSMRMLSRFKEKGAPVEDALRNSALYLNDYLIGGRVTLAPR